MSRMTKWMPVLIAVVAVAGPACRKKAESPTAPAADAGAPAIAAQDAAVPPVTDVAVPEGGPAAEEEAGAARPAGGMGMLAGMFGGGVAGAAPAASAPSPASALVRDTERELLARSDANAFNRTLAAAHVAQELPDGKRATPAPAGTGAAEPSTGPVGPAAPPNDADPCSTLVPSVLSCVSAQLGEAVSAEEITQAIAECRTEFGGWPAERQAALRACDATADCAARLQCAAALAGTGAEGPGGETPGPSTPPPEAGDDFCARFTVRSAQCMDAPIGAADLGSAIEACRSGFAEVPAEVRDGMAKCLDEPCDDLLTCLGAAGVSGQPSGTAATNEPPPGPPDLEGMFPTPDPARVATLPPDTRALCVQLATRIDECWDTIVGAVAGTTDPSAQAMLASIRPQIRPGMENACLAAATGATGDFQEMAAARRCFALPCDQLVTCIEDVESGQ